MLVSECYPRIYPISPEFSYDFRFVSNPLYFTVKGEGNFRKGKFYLVDDDFTFYDEVNCKWFGVHQVENFSEFKIIKEDEE